MAAKKQPETDRGEIHGAADEWFRQFLKHLELALVDAGQELPADAESLDYGLAAVRSVALTLRDAGLDDEQITGLFGRVTLGDTGGDATPKWNAELNRRRFELIDRDIQGTLSHAEQFELARLTQIMRKHVDSEANLPMEGVRELHSFLTRLGPGATDSDR